MLERRDSVTLQISPLSLVNPRSTSSPSAPVSPTGDPRSGSASRRIVALGDDLGGKRAPGGGGARSA